jgi:hypothetical protein
MADFQLKAYTEWDDILSSSSHWEVEIYQDLDLGGESSVTVMPFISSPDPLVFRFGPAGDLDTVIKATECTVNMIIPQGENFDWLITDFNPRKFKVKVIQDSVTQFWGFMINDQLFDNLEYNRSLSIIFSDQLNLLTKEDFLDGSVGPTTPDTLLNQLCRGLEATGLQLPINIACNIFHLDMQRGATYTPFNQAYLSQSIWLDDNFNPGKCGNVIEEILKPFWCRIFQSEGEWRIYRIRDLEKTPIYCQKFSYNGALISSETLTPQLSTSTSLQKFTPLIQRIHGGELEYSPDWKFRDLEIDYGLKPSLVSGLNADVFWTDPYTHTAWTNEGKKWYHIGYTVNNIQKGFLKCSTDDRIALNIGYQIYSPLANIYAVNSYVFTVICGRSNMHWPLISYCYVQLVLVVGGVDTYWYDDSTGVWEDDSLFHSIDGIDFPAIGKKADIATNLESRTVEVAAPPVDGQLRIVFYAPYRGSPLAINTYFYIGEVTFEIANEDENLPNGEVSRVNITSTGQDTFYVPDQYKIRINGGVVTREGATPGTFEQITTDRYFGLLALTTNLVPIDDDWVEIYATDSADAMKLKDWLLYHWQRHHATTSKSYEGSFRGRMKPTNVLKITEFTDTEFGTLYIWDDVEFHPRTGIWTGTWLHLKNKNTLKTGQTFESILKAYSINTNLAISVGGVSVSTKDEYHSNPEAIDAGEQTVTYLTPFSTDDDILLDPAIMGITSDGEILWAVPYWDSEIEETAGFKINFAVAVTIHYTARIIK